MKERLEIAEKILLLSIPYLIVLSLAYYWGYWGYFGIDAVSYYGVQDLIKSFAYALPAVAFIGLLILLVNRVFDYYINSLRNKFTKASIHLIVWPPIIILFALIVLGLIPATISSWVEPVGESMAILTALDIIALLLEGEWDWAISNSTSFFLLKWLSIFGIFSLFASYSYGRHEARNISNNKYFSYLRTEASSDTINTSLSFKFLGKAGDYYFFISPNNKERRIVSMQKIPNLTLRSYDYTDSVSVNEYRASLNRKTLKSDKTQASPTR